MLERHRDVLAYLPIGICHIINSSYVSQVVAQTQASATYGEVRKTQSSIIPFDTLARSSLRCKNTEVIFGGSLDVGM